ncbi:LysE family translocator [Caenispirillum bisanense]|uniref:LysE family translocator n=1 Tax=Caenispirillum bisanense TaxID=414052 RepID=UPI0031E1C01E
MSWDMWLVFVPATFLINLSPGPNNLLAMNNGVRFGFAAAMAGGLGRLPAFAALIGLTVVGLGALLATSVTAFVVLKWVGAAYLVYLGVKLWRAPVTDETVAAETGPQGRRLGLHLATREFMIAASNPKAILVFTAFFPQFLDPAQPAWPQLLSLGAVFLVLEMVALAVYAASGGGLGRFMTSGRGRRIINRISGTALIGAGVALAATRR